MNIYGIENYVLHKDTIVDGSRYKSKYPPFKKPLFCSKAYDSSKPTILILSPFGLQTDHIIGELLSSKSQFAYINLDEFVKKGKVHFSLNDSLYVSYGSLNIKLENVKSIYIDYFDLQEVFYFQRSDFSLKEQLFVRRWLYVLSLLEGLFFDSKWYPAKPSSMSFEKQNKIADLVRASQLGLKVPESILANDFKILKKFVLQNESLLKDSGLKAFYKKSHLYKFLSTKVLSSNLRSNSVSVAPVELQSYIHKKMDIRSYLIGKKLYSIAISSRNKMSSDINWEGSEKNYTFSAFDLPKKVESKLIRFANCQGFSLCSFDLLLTQENEVIFLEMNRPGQWYFAQMFSGLDLSSKIAKALRVKSE